VKVRGGESSPGPFSNPPLCDILVSLIYAFLSRGRPVYKGVSYDPNRTANYKGSPAYNIIQFAKKKGGKRILDNHSGGGVNKAGLIFYRYDAETKWYNYIHLKTGCTGQKIGGIVGSIRRVANDSDMSCITLEVERDKLATSTMAIINYYMLAAAMKFYGFP
jgi:hypothetical protein